MIAIPKKFSDNPIMFLKLLTLIALAGDAPSPHGIDYFSLCGQFDSSTKILRISDSQNVSIIGDAIPPVDGPYCIKGDLHPKESGFELAAARSAPNQRALKYPVMVCGKMYSSEFFSYWNEETIRFQGPFPKGSESPRWCADGKSLPKKKLNKWYFPSCQFRAMPDPDQRSGVSIGNQ